MIRWRVMRKLLFCRTRSLSAHATTFTLYAVRGLEAIKMKAVRYSSETKSAAPGGAEIVMRSVARSGPLNRCRKLWYASCASSPDSQQGRQALRYRLSKFYFPALLATNMRKLVKNKVRLPTLARFHMPALTSLHVFALALSTCIPPTNRLRLECQ